MITNLKIGYNGRFGNQLFQFASLLGIANKIGCQALIPESNKNEYLQKTMDGKGFQSKFELHNCFEIDDSIFSNNIKLLNLKRESTFHFDGSFFKIKDFTAIDGYFQSDKYFKHFEPQLRQILIFKDEIVKKTIKLMPSKKNQELVSIHIRRGDYTTLNLYHPVVSQNYLDKAVSYFNDKYHFLVFSDDIDWCKSNWGEDDRFTYFHSGSHFVDFCAMSFCHHHIISNSSFSWWSSYLSNNKNKKIIAPQKWFGPGFANNITNDLYREEMIVVS